MKRRWRRLLWIPLGLLLLLLILPFVIPAERWKNLAIDQLKARTGWEATAKSARISLIPLGLRILELAVEDPDGDQGYARFTAQAQAVVLRADLASVLRRAPRIQEIRLVQPQIELWTKAQAATDSAAVGEPKGATAPATARTPAISTLLAYIAIDDGSFTLHDADRTLAVHGLRQRIEFKLSGETFGAHIEGGWAGGEWQDPKLPRSPISFAELKLQADAQGMVDGSSLRLDPLRVESLGQVVQGSVELAGAPTARLDLALESSGELAELFAAMGSQLPLPPLLSSLALHGGALQLKLSTPEPFAVDAKPPAILQAIVIDATVGELRAELWQEQAVLHALRIGVQEGQLSLRDGSLSLPGASCEFALAGPLDPEQTLQFTAQVHGDMRVLRAVAARVVPQLPPELVADAPPPAEWPGLAGMIHGDVEVELPQTPPKDPSALQLVARLRCQRVAMLLPAWRDSLHADGGELTATATEMRLRDLKLNGPGLAGRANGSIWGWPKSIESEWDLALDTVDLDRLQAAATPPPAEKAMAPSWWSHAAYAAPAKAELPVPPANLGADLRVSAKEVLTRGYRLSQVEGRASLHERKLDITQTTAKLGSGEVAIDMNVDWNRTPPEWQGKTKARAVPASELVRPFAGVLADALSTNFDGEIQLDGPVSLERAQVLAALSGNASLASGAGALSTEPLLGEALKSFLGKHYQRFQRLDFRALTAGVSVREGRVHFDRFLLDGTTQLKAAGNVGLDGDCDYSLDILLPSGLTPQLGDLAPLAELLRDRDGRIAFRVDVDGPARQPKVGVDFDQLANLAQERAKQKAEGELNRLLERGLQSAVGDSTAGDTKALEEKGKDAVNSLLERFKKKKGKGAP